MPHPFHAPIRWISAFAFAAASLIVGAGAALAAANPSTIPSCQYTSNATTAYRFCSTGQASAVSVPSGDTVTYTFSYPGDHSNITFTSIQSGVPQGYVSAVGFAIYDVTKPMNQLTPVETATAASNQLSGNPNGIQFNYSSGSAGQVTVQLFNYSPADATFNLDDSGLVSQPNGTTTPVTLQLSTGPTPVSQPVPGVSPAPSGAATAGAPATIPSCQYTTNSTTPYPFCSTGQMVSVTLAANSVIDYSFAYPGDNSNITFTSILNGVPQGYASGVGFNVFDASKPFAQGLPVETATTLSNQLNSVPNQMQFNYSSGNGGPVVVQLFNYSPNPVTFQLNDSGLVAAPNGATTAVTLQQGVSTAA